MTRRQRSFLRKRPARRFPSIRCGECPAAVYDRLTRRWLPADIDLYLVAERQHGHRCACAMAAGFLPVPDSYRRAARALRASFDAIDTGRSA